MSPLEAAQKLLETVPLPDDIEARIDALYDVASDEEKAQFAWIYEALERAKPS